MPSTYIVITRKTLQSLPNSFANPLANWFFHLSSYVRVSYEHIYVYIYLLHISVFVFRLEEWKKKKKERRKGGIDRRPRPSRAKITSRFESRSVRVRVALVILTHLRTTPVLLALFCPPLHLRVESSRGESRRVESRRGARRIRGCVDRKENIRKWNRRSKLFLFSSALRSRTKRFAIESRTKVFFLFSASSFVQWFEQCIDNGENSFSNLWEIIVSR